MTNTIYVQVKYLSEKIAQVEANRNPMNENRETLILSPVAEIENAEVTMFVEMPGLIFEQMIDTMNLDPRSGVGLAQS